MAYFSIFKTRQHKRGEENSFLESMDDWKPEKAFAAIQIARVLNDSIKLIFKTINPDTFFSRYGFAAEQAGQLVELSRGKHNNYKARRLLEILQAEKSAICNDFLCRCFLAGRLDFAEEKIMKHTGEMSDESCEVFTKLLNHTEIEYERAAGSLALELSMLLSYAHPAKQTADSYYCNGDCANCAPHYGYRYGRWYYGRAHQGGCEKGGNGGADGSCLLD